jgi:hypothetical protein
METNLITVQAYNQFSENELIQSIPENKRQSIIARKPLLKAYLISQEGLSEPMVLNNTNQVVSKQKSIMKWTRDSINKFFDKLKPGLKFFDGHNKDNSTKDRKYLGEIVGKTQKLINNKLSNIIVGMFDKNYNLDTVSFEGVLEYINNGIEKVVNDVIDISGIALASSNEVKPGFDSAMELASVQFNETIIKEETNKEETKIKMSEVKKFDINDLSENEIQRILDNASRSQLVKTIQYRKFTPRDLFDKKDLLPNLKVEKGKFVSEDESLDEGLVNKLNEKIESHYKKIITDHETKLNEFETKLKDYSMKERIPLFKQSFSSMIDKKQVDEKAKAFMQKKLDKIVNGKEIPDNDSEMFKLVDSVFQELSDEYKEVSDILIGESKDSKQDISKQGLPIGGNQVDPLTAWLNEP